MGQMRKNWHAIVGRPGPQGSIDRLKDSFNPGKKWDQLTSPYGAATKPPKTQASGPRSTPLSAEEIEEEKRRWSPPSVPRGTVLSSVERERFGG